jgi:hypothetical protein
MKIVNDEKYEELAVEWQYQMIILLRNTLKKHKIDEEKVKDICGDFAFDLAMLQDQGEIEEYRPVICFESADGELFYSSDEDIQLHDYAYGSTDEAFSS